MSHLRSTVPGKVFFALLIAALLAPCASGQQTALTLTLDSAAIRHPDTAFLTVWLTNPADQIAAFRIWVQLDRPDLVKFIPSNTAGVGYDTVGTLAGGWTAIFTRSVGGQDFDLQVTGVANLFPEDSAGRIIEPSASPRPLIRLAVTTRPVPDTLSDRVAKVLWTSFPDGFSFGRPDGTSLLIGDASFANGWVGSGCEVAGDVNGDGTGYEVLDWMHLAGVVGGLPVNLSEPWQSDVNHDCVIDTADLAILYCVSHGQCSPPVAPGFACCTPLVMRCCLDGTGNVDCDPIGAVDIGDLTVFINNLFVTFEPLCCIGEADCNGDGAIDIGDLTVLIDNLFVSFSPLAPCPF